MNIREAKGEIIRTVEMYLDKNEFGEYTIPVSRQRPIFMTGAPGIGKTAVIQQIASELDLALVSGSMRHHTRQSAQGRPLIKARDHVQDPGQSAGAGGLGRGHGRQPAGVQQIGKRI